ncbi:MAG: oxygen-dependent coproporphyrinogen oxidase [Planctomycetota bacterium]
MAELLSQVESYFRGLQDRICASLEAVEGSSFHEDRWEYQGGRGGGRSRVLMEGKVFEKAGVNFSMVSGEFSEDFATTMPGSGRSFNATGVSLVLHPWNPKIPTVHANFRYLSRGDHAWFGGGADLTPYYPYREDCIHFHRVWRDVCQRHAAIVDYPKLKQWCDDYFFLKHRGEPRGIGGIFFDYLDKQPEETFRFVQDAGDHFGEAYVPILERRKQESFTDGEREFQLIRRGRYVEFNLVYDRGTVFGLKTGGRTESILMSLPLNVKWVYGYAPEPGSREAELFEFLKPRDWANEKD